MTESKQEHETDNVAYIARFVDKICFTPCDTGFAKPVQKNFSGLILLKFFFPCDTTLSLIKSL